MTVHIAAAAATACLLLLWQCLEALLWHPLSSYPGPPFAAITKWYRAYYNLVQDGGWLEHLERLHRHYGPVVRVAPSELHFSEPDAFRDIYSFSTHFTKDPAFYSAFELPHSSLGQADPAAAKIRRDAMGPLFSRQGIRRVEVIIQDKVDLLVQRLIQEGASGKPVNLFLAFRSFTLDTIMSYCFATSFRTLDHPHFVHPMVHAVSNINELLWLSLYFPHLTRLMHYAPRALIARLSPFLQGFLDMMVHLSTRVDEVMHEPDRQGAEEHRTVFHHLLQGKKETLSKAALVEEAITLVSAGSETTGSAVTAAVFRVLNDERVRGKVAAELREAWPDPSARLPAQELERLPYLTAVIKETHRLTPGVVSPAPRVVHKDSVIAGHHVPAGTVVAMGPTFVHMNAGAYSDPHAFRPERWLEEGAEALESAYLIPFSRGPRMCLGHNLAWFELYLSVAGVLRKCDISVYETDERDFRFRLYWTPVYRGRQLQGYVRPAAS
ncbi:cytochrome P450 [Schizophyllum fasciatum]